MITRRIYRIYMTTRRHNSIILIIRSLAIFFLLLHIGLSRCTGLSHANEIADINAAIKAKGANWVAGETSVSKLSPEEKSTLLSPMSLSQLQRSPGETTQRRALGEVPSVPVPALPVRYDLRNANGHSFVTPVRNQGRLGSCMEFSAMRALESRVLQAMNTPDSGLWRSWYKGSTGSNNHDLICDAGLPPESCAPYSATKGTCSSVCADWKSQVTALRDTEALITMRRETREWD
jgi:hypothetical protein